MTDVTPVETAALSGDAPIPDAQPVAYPDTTVGMLMKQRDEALANAQAAQDGVDRYTKFKQDAETRATSLQQAIDAMGGEQPMTPVADATQDTLDPSE